MKSFDLMCHCFPFLLTTAEPLCCADPTPRRMAIRAAAVSRCVLVGSAWVTCRAMSTNNSRRAAIAQLRSTSNKISNLVDIAKCAGLAREQGASMLFLPECFGFMSESSLQTLEQAEPPIMDDQSENEGIVQEQLCCAVRYPHENTFVEETENVSLLDGLKVIARASGMWISAGGMHESGAPPDDDNGDRPRVYNTHVIIDSDGKVQTLYRKSHLFDVSIPNKVNLQESATTAPGTKLVVCDSPVGRLGISTCYDVRFPEMYVDLVQKGGAEIILVPSAFTVPTGSAHWHTLLRARAIENQCYVLAAAQYGRHNAKRESYGHSLAVDPWGTVIADAGGCDGPGTMEQRDPPCIITCDVDLTELSSIRERMPIQQHRDAASFSF